MLREIMKIPKYLTMISMASASKHNCKGRIVSGNQPISCMFILFKNKWNKNGCIFSKSVEICHWPNIKYALFRNQLSLFVTFMNQNKMPTELGMHRANYFTNIALNAKHSLVKRRNHITILEFPKASSI